MQENRLITTSEGVEGLSPGSTAWSVSCHITQTLRERGRSDDYISKMSVEEIFSEYCTWHGLINWSNTLWDVVSVLKAIQKNGVNQVNAGDVREHYVNSVIDAADVMCNRTTT